MKRIVSVSFILAFAITLMSAGFFKTNLKVTVIDDTGNFVEGATVTLYNSEEDYNNENAAVDPLVSNKKGQVHFKNIEARGYFLYAKKGDKDNIFNGQKVKPLEEGKVNMINVIIE